MYNIFRARMWYECVCDNRSHDAWKNINNYQGTGLQQLHILAIDWVIKFQWSCDDNISVHCTNCMAKLTMNSHYFHRKCFLYAQLYNYHVLPMYIKFPDPLLGVKTTCISHNKCCMVKIQSPKRHWICFHKQDSCVSASLCSFCFKLLISNFHKKLQ